MLNGTVGSNPTLSAIKMEKYSSGSRGSPAKGLGWIKLVRGFESLLLRHYLTNNLGNLVKKVVNLQGFEVGRFSYCKDTFNS